MPCPDHPGHHIRCVVCEADNIAAADAARDDPRDARIAELEAFVREVENIETAWVTGTTSAQESMIAISDAWRRIRAKTTTV